MFDVDISSINVSLAPGANSSSQSKNKIQSHLASANDLFLAAAKSFTHIYFIIFSVYFLAISIVLSVEPVSTIMISSAILVTEDKHLEIFCSSFLAIIHTDNLIGDST